MKIAIITDTHFGCRSESGVFFDSAERFFAEEFFPSLDALGIKTVVHLGDLVDRRKYVAFVTANRMRRMFVDPIIDRGIELIILPGNHDLPFKNLVSINAERELLAPHPLIRVVETARVWNLGGLPVLMLPWICDENRQSSLDMIRHATTPACMGHLELSGFEMHRGQMAEHGMSPATLSHFRVVLSGHYHHKSSKGNVHYLGAPYEMTWSDYDDPRGFHVFDTETLELDFCRNPNSVFAKLYYDDADTRVELLDDVREKVVKIVIKSKNDPMGYDRFVECVEMLAANVQVVDDHLKRDVISDVEIASDAPDTLSLLTACTETARCDRTALRALLAELFNRAQALNA